MRCNSEIHVKIYLDGGAAMCPRSGTLLSDAGHKPGQYLCQKGRLKHIYIAESNQSNINAVQ